MTVIDEIAAERKRQIEKEGWTPEHDDQHVDWELAMAAAAYANPGEKITRSSGIVVPRNWPGTWAAKWWKPKDRRRNLIRAGALIVAEIERIDRKKAANAA